MPTKYSRGKPQHIIASSDNICFKSRWGWNTPAASHIKVRGTWAIVNFEERRENLTEGEKLFVFRNFYSAMHHYFHCSRLEFQRVTFCQILAAPPVRVCRRLTILSARDPKFDERLRDLLLRPCIFSGCEILHIFTPRNSLSWSLLRFSPTDKAETFLCNHALFIHLVIKERPNSKTRSFRKNLSPLHLKVRKCPQTEIYEWQLWRLKPIHKHLNGQNTIQTHNRYLSVPISLTTMYGMCVD